MVEDDILFTNHFQLNTATMGLSTLGGVLGILHQHLLYLVVARLNQYKISSDQLLVHLTKRNSVACHITSNSDFDQGGCVMQIEWTKAFCNNCQPML